MSNKPDINQQLEAMLGCELDADAVQFINRIQSVASSTRSEDSTTQKKSHCGKAQSVLPDPFSGRGRFRDNWKRWKAPVSADRFHLPH